jgi:hypothetical protein
VIGPDEDDIKRRAILAQRELAETQAAFDTMRKNAIEEWAKSLPADRELRDILHTTVQVIETVRNELLSRVSAARIVEGAEALRQEGF